MTLKYVWTDGNDPDFRHFYRITEQYYSRIVGGEENRKQFIPYNLSSAVGDVLLVYDGDAAVACSGMKKYSGTQVEIKRVWVDPAYRSRHIAATMMALIEERARQEGYTEAVLQTRAVMEDAVGLYTGLGYHRIGNYPPYNRLAGAICFGKEL